ncbi:hypothetical protein [Jeotgalibaca porci]|uniref:hypothetical protein n=1 Tax=Jeotgalibaca porci TaxID=1868793 RepID=UPI0035A04E43
MAEKWNPAAGEYVAYELPEGASAFENDMAVEVACAECGLPKTYGECCTSLFIHTFAGMGYAVCADCHEKEFVKEFQKGKDVVSWSEFKSDENNAEEMVESIVNRIDQVLAQLSPTDDYLLGLMDGLKRAKELLETS